MSSIMRWRRGLMVGLRDGGNAGIGARHRAAPSISTDRPLKRPIQVPAPPGETSRLRASPPGTFTNGCGLKLPRSGLVQPAMAGMSAFLLANCTQQLEGLTPGVTLRTTCQLA